MRLFSKLVLNKPYILDGFHLDFFLSLYHALSVPTFVLLPDSVFAGAVKYLSVLMEDRRVAFIPPGDGGDGGDEGCGEDEGMRWAGEGWAAWY